MIRSSLKTTGRRDDAQLDFDADKKAVLSIDPRAPDVTPGTACSAHTYGAVVLVAG